MIRIFLALRSKDWSMTIVLNFYVRALCSHHEVDYRVSKIVGQIKRVHKLVDF